MLAGTWLALAGLLVACETPKPESPPVDVAASAPAMAVAAASAPASIAPPSLPPPPAVAPSPPQVTPATIQTSQRQAAAAIEMLESGQEEQAAAELQRALVNDPNNKLALALLRQIQADPVATLGREHFVYRVQPGESLSKLAQRFLGDLHQFYILARYNELRTPRQLQAGQTIKVPGRAAPPSAALAASAPSASAAASAPEQDPAKAVERERQLKLAAAIKAARVAYARQDLGAAIRHWDAVLDLEPGHNTAKIERQRAVELKAKLDRLK